MKKLFLRFALFFGLLAGFASPALADEGDVTLDLTLRVSQYTGNEGGSVAMSNFFTESSATITRGEWKKIEAMTMPSTVRGDNKYNQVMVYAKANAGYTFKHWADADSKTTMPAAASTAEKTIYDGLWGYYIKRQLCFNPGDQKTDDGTYYQAYFHYHVKGLMATDHKDKYTLYAVFEPNQYTVTFMDGSTTVDTKPVLYKKPYGTLPTPTKTGYTFDGWFTTGGTQVHAADTYTETDNQTLYAHWTEQTYTIHFKDMEQGKTIADATYRVADGHMPNLPTTDYLLSATDKYFAGYYTSLNGTGERVYAGYADDANLALLATTMKLTSDITLYAHYSHVHHQMYWDYTYYGDDKAYHHMTKNNPTDRIQYARLTFKNAAGAEFKNVILFTENPDNKAVQPTSDLATHTMAEADIHLYIGSSTPSGSVINKDGGEHKVYFTDEELSDFHSYTFEPIKNDEETVHPLWIATTQKETHNTILNFTGADADNCYTQKWSVVLDGLLINPDIVYVMPLYNTANDDDEWQGISQLAYSIGVPCAKVSEAGGKATYNGSFLVWKGYDNAIGLVGFKLGGKDYFMNTDNPGVFSSDYNSAEPVLGTADPGKNNETIDPNKTIVYTVPASQIPVIRFLANGGVLGATTPSYLVAAYNAEVSLSAYTATREHYTFKGWKAVEGGQIYTTTITADKAYTLEAQWEGKASTVTLHHNDGSDPEVTETVMANYMAAMPALLSSELPTRDGYTFKGYWDVDDVKYYDENGASAHVYDKTANSDLYAGWKAQTYTVTLDHNDGTSTPETVTATYGEPMADVTVPTWYGHAFLGYFDGEEATATKYIDATGHCILAWDKATTATLYAHWETVEISITARQDPKHPSDYYTTFYLSSVAYQITTENVTIFIATRATDGKLYLEEVADDVIPAGEAVLLQATQSDIHLAPVESTLLKNENNIFEGVDEETAQAENYTYYVFGMSQADKVVGFYQYEWDTTRPNLAANKAFFKAPKGSQQASAPRYVIHHTDVTTGMEAATMEKAAVRKMIVNGQLVIEREGKLYNAQGVVIK